MVGVILYMSRAQDSRAQGRRTNKKQDGVDGVIENEAWKYSRDPIIVTVQEDKKGYNDTRVEAPDYIKVSDILRAKGVTEEKALDIGMPPEETPGIMQRIFGGNKEAVQSVGVPCTVAMLVAPPYTFAKQVQNNMQVGSSGNPFAMKGLGAVMSQQQLRFLMRMGPIPIVQAYVEENISKTKEAKIAATVCSGSLADALLVPTEGMATRKQTAVSKSILPPPPVSVPNVWQTSPSALSFTREMYRGLSATVAKQVPFWLVLTTTKEMLKESGKDKFWQAAVSAGVATAVNTALTPLSTVQQLNQKANPIPTFSDALKAVASRGFKGAYQGWQARVAITGVSAGGVAATMAIQDLLKEYENKEVSVPSEQKKR